MKTVVDGLDGALAHIARHASHHTDAIIADDAAAAGRFLAEVDSAIVMWNASTQFADGGEFGLGAEIGISTGRLHARGPVALEGIDDVQMAGARNRPGAALMRLVYKVYSRAHEQVIRHQLSRINEDDARDVLNRSRRRA